MSDHNLKTIVLAAGMGTRLRPYTENKPKCLVEINGTSLLDSQLDILKGAGISNITLIAGYKSEMFKERAVNVIVNENFATTNMVSSLFCAESELNGNCLISYGDIVYSADILAKLLESKADIAVVVDKNWQSYWQARFSDPLDDAETLKLSAQGQITEIGNKAKSLVEIEGQYIGLMKFSDKGLQQLKQQYRELCQQGSCMGKPIENAYMTDIIQEMINSGYPVTAVPVYSEWIEVDSVSDLQHSTTLERYAAIMNK